MDKPQQQHLALAMTQIMYMPGLAMVAVVEAIKILMTMLLVILMVNQVALVLFGYTIKIKK